MKQPVSLRNHLSLEGAGCPQQLIWRRRGSSPTYIRSRHWKDFATTQEENGVKIASEQLSDESTFLDKDFVSGMSTDLLDNEELP